MPKDYSLSDAGSLIEKSGITRDVIHADEKQIAQRRGRQREDAADAHEDSDDRDSDELDADDDADTSTHDDGDEPDGEQDDDTLADEGEGDDDGDEDADDKAQSREATHKVKVNGKEFEVTTSELKAGYQRGTDYQQKTQALAQRGRDLSASHVKAAEIYTKKLHHINAINQGIRNLLVGDMDSREMRELRATDPNQWMVARTDYEDRIKKVDAVINGLTHEYGKHAEQLTAQQQEHLKHTIEHEREVLKKYIPDWDGEGKLRLGKYLTGIGFTHEELVNVVDARMLTVAEKARKWDAMQAQSKKATRKAKPAPKQLKPGATQMRKGGGQQTGKVREFERAKKHAKTTGNMRDAGKAISRLL